MSKADKLIQELELMGVELTPERQHGVLLITTEPKKWLKCCRR